MTERPLELTYRIDLRTIPLMNQIMANGMRVNPDSLATLGKKWDLEIEAQDAELDQLTGIPDINWGSSVDVSRVLFQEMGIPPLKRSKTTGVPSADKKTLEEIRDRYDGGTLEWQVMNKVQERRSKASFKTAWVDKALRERDSEDRIHTVIKNTRVVSGRWSMADPFNFMAVPHEGSLAIDLRRCFVPEPGWVLWTGDYSGLEMRHTGSASGDTRMLGVFNSGLDIHTETASLCWSIPYDSVDKWKHRYPAKRVGFGNLFGITPEGLMPHMPTENRNLDFCRWLLARYFEVHPGVKRFIDQKHAETEDKGRIKDMWGRVRLIPEVHSALRWIRESGLREAFSHFIQGSATGTIKVPMSVLLATLDQYPQLRWRPWPQVHDELAFEVHPDDVELFDIVVGNLMANATSLGDIPLVVNTDMGENWGDTETLREYVGSFQTEYCGINPDIAPDLARLAKA